MPRTGNGKYRGYVFETVGEIFNTFYSRNLPFELTGAQKRVLKEIRQDVGSGRQMKSFAARRCGKWKDVGGIDEHVARLGQWISGLYDGTYGNSCKPAL